MKLHSEDVFVIFENFGEYICKTHFNNLYITNALRSRELARP